MQFGISFDHLPVVTGKKAPKIDYEYQAVCLEVEEFFGKSEKTKVIWTLPWKKGVTESLLRYALKECKTRQKPYIGYFLKIINNQLKPKPVCK